MKPFLFAVVGSQLGCYQSLLQLQTSSSQAVSAGAISTAAIALPSPISTREVITIDDDSDGSVYEDPIDHSDDRMSYISGVSMICLDTEPPKDASPDASVLSDSSVLFDEEDASEAFTDTPDTSQQSQLNGNSGKSPCSLVLQVPNSIF